MSTHAVQTDPAYLDAALRRYKMTCATQLKHYYLHREERIERAKEYYRSLTPEQLAHSRELARTRRLEDKKAKADAEAAGVPYVKVRRTRVRPQDAAVVAQKVRAAHFAARARQPAPAPAPAPAPDVHDASCVPPIPPEIPSPPCNP